MKKIELVPAEDLGIICKGPNDPVDKALEHGIQQAVAEVEQERPRVSAAFLEIDAVGQFAMVVLELVGQAASPDWRSEESPDRPIPAVGEAQVEELPMPVEPSIQYKTLLRPLACC